MTFLAPNFLNMTGMPGGFANYIYKSDTDTKDTVVAAGYFNNVRDNQKLSEDDIITVIGDQGGYTLRVINVTVGGTVITLPRESKTVTIIASEEAVFDADVTVSPSAASIALVVAVRGRVTTGNTNAVTGDGHNIGGFFSAHHAQVTTHPLIIGAEGFISNDAAGTITVAIGVESHIAQNLGTITSAYCFNADLGAVAGTIGTATGYNFSAATGAVTVTNTVGYNVGNLNDNGGSGDLGTITGFNFANQSSNGSTGSMAFVNLDTGALGMVDAGTTDSVSGATGSIQTQGGMGAIKNITAGALLLSPSLVTGGTNAGTLDIAGTSVFISTTTTGSKAMVLPDGIEGQEIVLEALTIHASGPAVVTPSNPFGFATLTFSASGQTANLRFASSVWSLKSAPFGAIVA